MNSLMIKGLLIVAIFSGWSLFLFKAGVNSEKASVNKAAEKQFSKKLKQKQTELDAALKLNGDWQKKVSLLQKRKPAKVTREKDDIKNNNIDCTSIDGFGLFIDKLSEVVKPASDRAD